jgi:hypothetical protein
MPVEFTNNTARVIAALDDAAIAYLHEAAGELQAQTKRNSRPVKYGRHDVKNSWKYNVDESKQEAKIGSELEASYWEELGTGEYAINHDGRKGWWVYVEGNDTPQSNQKYYTEDEAKSVAAGLRAKGLPAHATNGTEANRPMLRAFNSKKAALVRRAEQVFKTRMEE